MFADIYVCGVCVCIYVIGEIFKKYVYARPELEIWIYTIYNTFCLYLCSMICVNMYSYSCITVYYIIPTTRSLYLQDLIRIKL